MEKKKNKVIHLLALSLYYKSYYLIFLHYLETRYTYICIYIVYTYVHLSIILYLSSIFRQGKSNWYIVIIYSSMFWNYNIARIICKDLNDNLIRYGFAIIVTKTLDLPCMNRPWTIIIPSRSISSYYAYTSAQMRLSQTDVRFVCLLRHFQQTLRAIFTIRVIRSFSRIL